MWDPDSNAQGMERGSRDRLGVQIMGRGLQGLGERPPALQPPPHRLLCKTYLLWFPIKIKRPRAGVYRPPAQLGHPKCE